MCRGDLVVFLPNRKSMLRTFRAPGQKECLQVYPETGVAGADIGKRARFMIASVNVEV